MIRAPLVRGALKRARVATGASAAFLLRKRRRRNPLEPGLTVVSVNWNSLAYLKVMTQAVRELSPSNTRILIVDNHSSDGSLEFLRQRTDIDHVHLPFNVGHGAGLDLAIPFVRTEYVATLDIDAFPISDSWVDASLDALGDSRVAGAHMYRNYIHPCFLVTRTSLLRDLELTFRPVGQTTSRLRKAPLFLDVGEALSQRVIVHFGGGQSLHRFPITTLKGPGMAGAVFGDLVYHNQGATWGPRKAEAPADWAEAIREHRPPQK